VNDFEATGALSDRILKTFSPWTRIPKSRELVGTERAARPCNLHNHDLSAGSAYAAGPYNTGSKGAGSGPTPGATGQSITTGAADTKAHLGAADTKAYPRIDTMNQAAGDKAMSAQDAQREQQRRADRRATGPGGHAISKNGRRGWLNPKSS
jgi:hypothetical protein